MKLDSKTYKCVQCGESASALFKQYGPSVLKLSKCEQCRGYVDKYVEYDPVIVMIDLLLMSKEAQRHIIYNSDFKAYWKVLLIVMVVETYGLWKNDSLSTIVINTYCTHTRGHTHYLDFLMNEESCKHWSGVQSTDLFFTEINFYILFVSVFLGVIVFILSTQCLMWMTPSGTKHNVSLETLTKAFALSNVKIVFTLAALIWGRHEPTHLLFGHALHYLLVFLYSAVMSHNVYSVVYERHLVVTAVTLLLSSIMKFNVTTAAVPYLKQMFN